jgi:hypothetical protein
MKTLINFMLFSFLASGFFSCQKELSVDNSLPGSSDNNGNPGGGTGNASIIGDWNFLALELDLSSTTEANVFGDKLKTSASYETTTTNNSGILTITSDNTESKNLTYSISTEIYVMSSTNGVPDFDEPLSIPFDFDVPPSNGSGKYVQVGTDSLYFPEGTFISIPAASSGLPSDIAGEPTGAKFSIVSDTLRILGNINQTGTQNQGGVNFVVTQKGSAVAIFKRK